MKTAFASLLASFVFASACGDTGNADLPVDAKVNTPDAPASGGLVEVPAGDLTGPVTWEAKNTYVLKGQVFVTGGTLTIEAGTVIKGEAGSVLTITKSATLMAQGTVEKPIVFTSAKTTPTSGDWGGLVMLGAAPINVTGNTNKVEGFPESVGTKIEYGGANASHNCGTLKYARIEYAGFQLSADNELNGLTLEEMQAVSNEIGSDVFDALELGSTLESKSAVGGTARSNVNDALTHARTYLNG